MRDVLHWGFIPMVKEQPAPALISAVEPLEPGNALDLACGKGRHAMYLARLGWRVTAVDSSSAALDALRERARFEKLEACISIVEADLEAGDFLPRAGGYDLIVAWLYLQRDLFPRIREGLRPGGVAACSVRLTGRFAARPGELRSFFEGWEILTSTESAEIAEIVAKKPL